MKFCDAIPVIANVEDRPPLANDARMRKDPIQFVGGDRAPSRRSWSDSWLRRAAVIQVEPPDPIDYSIAHSIDRPSGAEEHSEATIEWGQR